MQSNGWIKIHRQLLDWEWYDEPNTLRLFLHLLLKANHKPKKYRGLEIQAGQVVTGYDNLAIELNLSVQNIRTSISKLKSTNELTSFSNSKGTVIQIVKYKDFQVLTSELTVNQQTTNKRVTTNKNEKNEKNKKNKQKKENDFLDKYANDNSLRMNPEVLKLLNKNKL